MQVIRHEYQLIRMYIWVLMRFINSSMHWGVFPYTVYLSDEGERVLGPVGVYVTLFFTILRWHWCCPQHPGGNQRKATSMVQQTILMTTYWVVWELKMLWIIVPLMINDTYPSRLFHDGADVQSSGSGSTSWSTWSRGVHCCASEAWYCCSTICWSSCIPPHSSAGCHVQPHSSAVVVMYRHIPYLPVLLLLMVQLQQPCLMIRQRCLVLTLIGGYWYPCWWSVLLSLFSFLSETPVDGDIVGEMKYVHYPHTSRGTEGDKRFCY